MSSPGGYVTYPIERIPADLLDDAFEFIKDKAPEWVENDANLDVWILQVVAAQAADLLTLAHDVPETIFQYYGYKLLGIAPLEATPATVDSTWTMVDNAGYTIPAGTQVSIRDSAGVEHGFTTTVDVIVPSGSTATAAGAVTLSSIEAGAALSGLGGNGYVCSLIDTLSFVSTVVLTESSSGGANAELSSEYNNRLSRKLQRLSERPVLAADYSLAALDVAGVYRALSLDGYNPSNQTYNNERYVAVAAVDELGQPISSGLKTTLQAYLDGIRETNFVVNVFDPTVSQVKVTFNVKCIVGYTTATVQANAVARVTDYLSPAKWGRDPSVTDETAAAQTWVVSPTVIYNKIIDVLSEADGVNYVISMTMALQAGTLGTADITLPGAAPLASAGTITGTATA